jgi:hypothetical protein
MAELKLYVAVQGERQLLLFSQHLHELIILLIVFLCRRVSKNLMNLHAVTTIDLKERDAAPATHVRYFLKVNSLQAFYRRRLDHSLIIAIEVIYVA